MNSKAQPRAGTFLDKVKWLLVVVIIAAGVYGNHFFASESILYRVIALLVLACVAVGIALATNRGRNFWALLKEARLEIRKVVWPTRQETLQTTTIVLITVVLMALILWAVDSLLGWVIKGFVG